MSGKGERQSGQQAYQTPPQIIGFLEEQFGKFTIDGAADASNHVAPRWFGPGGECEDAFQVDAELLAGERIFCNPPYRDERGRPWVGAWVELMAEWAEHAGTVVGLVPAGLATSWFTDIVFEQAADVWFVKPRISFIDPATGKPKTSPDSESLIIVFQRGGPSLLGPVFRRYNWQEGTLW